MQKQLLKNTAKSAVVRDKTKPLTKTQLIATIAEMTELEKRSRLRLLLTVIPVLLDRELKKTGQFSVARVFSRLRKNVFQRRRLLKIGQILLPVRWEPSLQSLHIIR